ncbi:MAG: DUF1501 domain-containing protein [Gemmataceae bacterium]|nr:DUF1501 domain-containing protein [Gemmataceae bacterium]MCI0739595.1 DUF1501 domain-containing protein [Gemmataceae bacterium]
MFRILGRPLRACDGCTRRELLQIGGAGALGLSLSQLGAAQAQNSAASSDRRARGRAHACILVYLFGGPSQLDTFDLKPDAPAHFRGEFRPIATNVPGIRICEHLPRLARQADKYCLLRGMWHEHPRHGWGLYYMLTGRRHNRPDLDAPPTPDDHPGLGALVNRLKPARPDVPTAVTLPRWNRFLDLPNDYAGEKAGFLGSAFDPWLVRADASGLTFRLDELALPADVPPARLDQRRDLLSSLDRGLAQFGERGQVHDALHARAYRLLSGRAVRRAFDLSEEPLPMRDRYGPHPFGQGLLLARRLVEAGTTLVQVNWHNDGSDVKSPFWDTHQDNFNTLRNQLLPPVDVGLSALLIDLTERGLLDSTLVLVMGEFGRTPRIGQVIMNAATSGSGRDHWPHAYTVLAAGAGMPAGALYGATDDKAAYVVDGPVSPPDLQATVLHLLGLDPVTVIHDRQGRPHFASEGQVVRGLVGS